MYLKTAYHLAIHEIPKSSFKSTLELIEAVQESPIFKSDKVSYTSNDSISEFHSVLVTIVKNNKIFDINSSPGFSVSIDESTDISNKKHLITYIEYLHNNVKQTCFLSNVQITTSTANAEKITEILLEELRSNDIDINKLYGISTDGASVMTGRKSGVVVRLRGMPDNSDRIIVL